MCVYRFVEKKLQYSASIYLFLVIMTIISWS